MRKGVILLISVALLAVLSPLILVNLHQADELLTQTQKEQFTAQRSILLKDIVDYLNDKSTQIETNHDLEILFKQIPSITHEGLSLNLSITPLLDKVNLNNLLFQNKLDTLLVTFINNLATSYDLTHGQYLVNILLDTIDEDDSERAAFSEIVVHQQDFRNGQLVSMDHLKEVLKAYYLQTGDDSIYKIPWIELVYFGPKDRRYIIDCERVEKEILDLFGFAYSDQSGCERVLNVKNKVLASSLKVNAFDKRIDYLVKVDIGISKEEQQESLRLIYNLKNQQVEELKKVWL